MWISSASKPASTRVREASAYAVVTRARSSSVAARTHCIDSGLGMRLAAIARAPFCRPWATGPAWPS